MLFRLDMTQLGVRLWIDMFNFELDLDLDFRLTISVKTLWAVYVVFSYLILEWKFGLLKLN